MGLAAVNTGNNLLYVLFGALLGTLVLSRILSERSLRGIRVQRTLPRAVTAGQPFRIGYSFQNISRWMPGVAVEARDRTVGGAGFAVEVPPRSSVSVKATGQAVMPHRGVYRLDGITISTGFPFGFFRREWDVDQTANLVVWPRSDREPAPELWGEERVVGRRLGSARPATGRGEFRALREYRSGDDRRDIHWKRTARVGTPIIREYEHGSGETVWICLDTSHPPGPAAEDAVERAASSAAYALSDGRRVGLLHPGHRINPDMGQPQLERILDELAAVDFDSTEPLPEAPTRGRRMVVITPAPSQPTAVA